MVIGAAILAIILAGYIGYRLHIYKKDILEQQIYTKIDQVFNGSNIVIDGEFRLPDGELIDIYPNPQGIIVFPLCVKYEWLDFWRMKGLHTVYYPDGDSKGFSVIKATRYDKGTFDIEIFESKEMGYKIKDESGHQPTLADFSNNDKTKTSDGYLMNNTRPNVEDCYISAFNSLLNSGEEQPLGAPRRSSYSQIEDLPYVDLRTNKYFYVSNSNRNKKSKSGSPKWTSTDGVIQNNQWLVFFFVSGRQYEVVEDEDMVTIGLYLHIFLSMIVMSVILFTILQFKPKYFRNLDLYGKYWRSKDDVLYFEHSFVGRNTITEISNINSKKGNIRFIDRGNTIIIAYTDRCIYYRIVKINAAELVLMSKSDNTQKLYLASNN